MGSGGDVEVEGGDGREGKGRGRCGDLYFQPKKRKKEVFNPNIDGPIRSYFY